MTVGEIMQKRRKRREGSSSCFTCPAFADTAFEALPANDVHALDVAKVTHHFAKGDSLFKEGEDGGGLWCVGAGLICERRQNARGEAVPLRLRAEGAVLGLQPFITGDPVDVAAEALRPSRVCFIPAETVRLLLSRNLHLALAIVRGLLEDLRALEQRLVALRPLSPRSRLAALLLDFANQLGVWRANGSCALRPPLAVRDLATVIGVPVAVAADTLAALANEGVLFVSERRFEILDADRLRAIAAEMPFPA